MFDDQITPAVAPPPNLPMEPEDMLAGVEAEPEQVSPSLEALAAPGLGS